MASNLLLQEFIYIMIWVSIWGITDNIIGKFVVYENYDTRLLIFSVMLVIILFLRHYLWPYISD